MSDKHKEKEYAALAAAGLKDGVVVFDVGCSYGIYTEAVLRIMGAAQVEVHCFEPVLDFYNIELAKFAGKQNVYLNNIALSNCIGEIPFCRIKANRQDMDGCSSFILRPEFVRNKWPYVMTTAKVDTIDNYIKERDIRHIDWLKIDVEGAEYSVLLGGEMMLGYGIVDRIQFEYGTTFTDAGISFAMIEQYVSHYGYVMCNFVNGKFVRMKGFRDNFSYNNYYIFKDELL